MENYVQGTALYLLSSHETPLWDNQAYLSTSVVKNAWLWLVGLDRGHIDDGTALLHVLHSMLRNGEVGKDVGVEGALQAFSADLLKLVNLLVLPGSIVDQDVDAAPLLDCLIHYVPACKMHLVVFTRL